MLELMLALVLMQPQAAQYSFFIWEQDAPSLAEAQGYTYKYYLDGSLTGIDFTGVTCSGTGPAFICEVRVPPYVPGQHTIELTASNVAGESPKTAPFAFNYVVTPSAPSGLRVVYRRQ